MGERLRSLVAAAAAGGLLLACAGTARQLPPAAALETQALEANASYVIGPNDVLQITVWKNPELSLEQVVVRPDGKISFPLLDDVQAAGLTPLELKQVLADRLSEYITAPHVTVVVRQINSKNVYVLGEVARQGAIPLRVDMRVVDALALAGGFTPYADRRRVKIIRNVDGSGPVEFVFDYEAFVEGRNLEQNIPLLPGDKIVVP